MSFENEKKIASDMADKCSTGQPFILEELKPDDLYNFTLASCIYGGYTGRKRLKLRPYQMRPAWRVVESVTQKLGLEIVVMLSRQCIHEDSYITLENGNVIKIKDIQKGESILSIDNKNKITSSRILDKWHSGIKKIYRVTTKKGHYLDVTEDHKFLTPDGFLSVKEGLGVHTKIRPSSMRLNHDGMVGICKKGLFKNKSNMSNKALILGYFIADGSCSKGQSPKFTNINKKYLDEFESIIKLEFGIKVKRYTKGNGEDLLITNGSHATKSNPFINWLREIELYGKSGDEKTMPDLIFNLDKNDTCLFLNRLYSADGWITSNKETPEIGLSAHCYHYAIQAQSLLSKLGIISYINISNGKKSKKDFYKVRISDKESVKTFFRTVGPIFGKEEQSEKAFFLSNKIYKKFPGFSKSDILFDFVKSIEYVGEKNTFDLSIKHTENFVANGLIVHNSGKTTGLPGAGLHFLSALPTIFKPMRDGFQAGVFGPKKPQASHAFDMYKFFHDTNFLHDHLGIKTLKNNSEELWLSNGVRIYCETASINAMIERLTLDLAYCEEAQNIQDTRLLNSIYPMCASCNGTRVLTGTPTPERLGHFYNVSSRAGNNIFVSNWEDVIRESQDKYARDYETYVTKEMNKHGRQSDYFKTQYDLEWTSVSANFVTIEELTALQKGNLVLQTDEPVVVGIDPARVNDSTILTVMSMVGKPHICLWAEWQGDDWKTQATDIESILSNYTNIFIVNIDTLHGEGISDYLPESVPVARVPMERNIQSFMWQELRKAIVNGEFTYPAVDRVERYRFENQMTTLTAKWVGNLFKVAAPNRRNMHDDYGDSLALAWFALCTRPRDSLEPTEMAPIVPRKMNRPRMQKPKGFTRPGR